MKKIFLLLSFTAILIAGCRYPEGPGISLNDPEDRIFGYWQLGNVFLNGKEISSTNVYPNQPGSYYTFLTEGVFSITAYYNGSFRETPIGNWYFQNKYTELVLDYSFVMNEYHYVATIKKLTMKELVYEYDDLNGDHWRLELFSRD